MLYRDCGCSGLTLRTQDTREPMLMWLAAALESNAERGKTIVNEQLAAPDGFFANLNSVLLALCQPFLQPSLDLAWRRIDVRCGPLAARLRDAAVLHMLVCLAWRPPCSATARGQTSGTVLTMLSMQDALRALLDDHASISSC